LLDPVEEQNCFRKDPGSFELKDSCWHL